MSNSESTRSLPTNPDFRHLKLEAKSLLKSCHNGEQDALTRVEPFRNDASKLNLATAQFTIAREYGFRSWTKLKIHVENASKSFAEKLHTFLSEGWSWGDSRRAAAALQEEPELADANIFAACVAGNATRVRDLLDTDPNLATTTGGPKKWTPILYATWSYLMPKQQDAQIEVMQLLLEHGADPNDYWRESGWNRTKESALYGCVDANCDRAATVMLEAGADPNDGESLYHACEKGNLAMLQTLGDHGLNEKDISYCIKHAMDFRWSEGIDWFLSMGADPNAVHPSANETSLHWAVKRSCSLRTIESLLEHGADPNRRTAKGTSAFLGIQGWTPCDFALRLGRTDVVQLLKNAGATPTPSSTADDFLSACAAGDRPAAQAILAQHPNIQSTLDEHNQAMVTHVAQVRSWDGVRLMVELGWKPDQNGGWMGATPLHWAACYGNDEIFRFLVERGADPQLDVGGYFGTPLNTILQCRWERGHHARILKYLLDAGISVPEKAFPCGNKELDEVWTSHDHSR